MPQLTEFFKNNLECQDRLNKLRAIIKSNFGIDDFWHLTVHENGLLANVSTYYEQWGHFWDKEQYNNLNFIIAPSLLRDSAFLLEYDKEFTDITDSFKDSHPQHHPFIIIRKEGREKAHIFGFAARKHMPSLPSFYLNNVSLLTSFFHYYRSSYTKFLRPLQEHMINIASLKGHKRFYGCSYGEGTLVHAREHMPFFKQLGMDSRLLTAAKQLSPREKEVLEGCLDHKTASQTAEKLGLSMRTVQFYLENVKNKLGIFSREELLEQGAFLKIAGLL